LFFNFFAARLKKSVHTVDTKNTKKITQVLLDESFEDILINVGVDVSYDECNLEVKTSDSSEPFNCEVDQKISDIL